LAALDSIEVSLAELFRVELFSAIFFFCLFAYLPFVDRLFVDLLWLRLPLAEVSVARIRQRKRNEDAKGAVLGHILGWLQARGDAREYISKVMW
jgi:hypothetical protein